MSSDRATLLAASIAAAVSLISLLFNLRSSHSVAMKAGHREALRPYLGTLSKSIHDVVASASIIRKRFLEGQTTGTWIKRGKGAQSELKTVRHYVRYTLVGIDDSIREMSNVFDKASTYKDRHDSNFDEFFYAVDDLAESLHKVIFSSYANGRPPTWWQRGMLKRKQQKVSELWEARDAAPKAADGNNGPVSVNSTPST